ncbi:hypothetical protein [Elizabethkingia anophelis]|nr:hypothetical protein [Elizabethkingia anophelis]
MKLNYIKYGAYLALLLGGVCICIFVFKKGEELGKAAAINN